MVSEKVRGFEIVQAYQDKSIQLPQRQTHHSAGYDLEAAEEVILEPVWKQSVKYCFQVIGNTFAAKDKKRLLPKQLWKATLVPTGLKVYMQEDEYLKIVNRSSGFYKHKTSLPNGIGIVDQDYYNNPNNEGHIYVQLLNFGPKDRVIKKGERIAQAIFSKYLCVDDDQPVNQARSGGFGSSDETGDQERKD